MKFNLDGLTVYFPYEYIYPEQYRYMQELKRALDAKGHSLLEMPTGTGKTITLLSLITSYQLAHPEVGKLVYCTRTVPEMEKVLCELQELMEYRRKYFPEAARPSPPGSTPATNGSGSGSDAAPGSVSANLDILAIGLSSRKNLCIHPRVMGEGSRESVDAGCRRLTASWVRERAAQRHADSTAGGSTEDGRTGKTGAGQPARFSGRMTDDASSSVRNHSAAASASGGGSGERPVKRTALETALAAAGDAASAVDASASFSDIEDIHKGPLCGYFEGIERAGSEVLLPPGVYTLDDLREFGRRRGWCPYFLARRLMPFANVLVYNYQYMLDPKVSQAVSRELEKECVVVFDEAHNIDNVCIEALSVSVRQQTLDGASRNIAKLTQRVNELRELDAERLQEEYRRLVAGLAAQGVLGPGAGAGGGGGQGALVGGEEWLSNPVLPEDVMNETVPGNMRRAEHFLSLLARLVSFFRDKLSAARVVTTVAPPLFLAELQTKMMVDGKSLRFCYDRLTSLLKTLEIVNTDEFTPVQLLADFATLVGTYAKGFAVITEPYDERMASVPDPVIQLSCLDASLAMRPVFGKFQSVVITSGTLSPLRLYPRILDFNPVSIQSFEMTLPRNCICPVVLTRGSDQMPLSTKFDERENPNVVHNYGKLLVELSSTIPDGIICFFVSYRYLDFIVTRWHVKGILEEILAHKLVFIETQDVVETTLALDSFRRACDSGRGAVFLSVARGKVAEGIDFDRHYGRAVVMFGIPYQYTLSRVLRARLEYLRDNFQIKENDYLTFDAIRQAAQCVGRVIRSKADYGMMIFADKRYQRHDKRDKLPGWITRHLQEAHMNLSTDMLITVVQKFLRSMAQPYDAGQIGRSLLSAEAVAALGQA